MAGTGFDQYLKGDQGSDNQNNNGTDAKAQLSQLAFQGNEAAAPSSATARYLEVTGKGLLHAPAGALHALEQDFGSWDGLKGTMKMVGTSAALGVALKTLLPEGGIAGKVAGLAIGGYFTAQAATPILESYKEAGNAKTQAQLDAAGNHLGNAVGEFGANSLIAAGGYKLGAMGANRMLATEAADGFMVKKAEFWHPTEKFLTNNTPEWLSSRLITPEAIQRARTLDVNTYNWDVKGNTATLLDSMRDNAPKGESAGPIDPNAKFSVSVYAKSLDPTGLKLDRRLARIASGKADFVGDQEMAAKFGGDPTSMKTIHEWAQNKGLDVKASDPRTGRIVLEGTGSAMENALGTKLEQWKSPDGVIHRGRVGALSVDSQVAPHIESILGADNRPQMGVKSTGFVPLEETPTAPPVDAAGQSLRPKPLMADDIARARGVPESATGAGKVVGIGELGGDLDLADNAKFYADHGKPVPDIIKKGVNGTEPKSDGPNGADGEVALDTQVVGLTAPKAKQVIAFGENSDAGFPDTQNEMAFPTDSAPPADVISWSWGQGEAQWTAQSIRTLAKAFQRSAAKGITTFVASGDDGAVDRNPSGKATVDYPSGDVNTTGVGGTQLILQGGKVAHEVAWNDGKMGGQTGGGISEKIPRPDYQKGLDMPANINGTKFDGRGVPDVAENASPRSGYIVRVGGQEGSVGGTSGAAPQWAAYTVDASQIVGKNFGNINPFLYKNGTSGMFSDITSGDNYGYKSGPGWDAVTGWGTPIFPKLIENLQRDLKNPLKARDFVPTIQNQPGDQQNSGR